MIACCRSVNFSKICKVSTKTLRYYDEIGLLHPEDIHPENGYRYYSIKQLKEMLLINRFKSYHFSLEEIKTILDVEEDQAEEMLGLALQRKRQEVQAKIHAYEFTLTQMNQDILRAETGKPMMSWFDDIEVELAKPSQ